MHEYKKNSRKNKNIEKIEAYSEILFENSQKIHSKIFLNDFKLKYGDVEYFYDDWDYGCPICKYLLENWYYYSLPNLVNKSSDQIKNKLDGFHFKTESEYYYCAYPNCSNYKKIFWIVEPSEEEKKAMKLFMNIEPMQGKPIIEPDKSLIDYLLEEKRKNDRIKQIQKFDELIKKILENGTWITKRKHKTQCENCFNIIKRHDVVLSYKEDERKNSYYLCETCGLNNKNRKYEHLKKLQTKKFEYIDKNQI